MKKKLLVLLFSLTTLALVSCGGGNDGASTGTPVVAQATIGGACHYGNNYNWVFNIQDGITCSKADGWGLFYPTANGGCGNSSSFGYSGPALTVAQQAACNFAIYGSAPGIGVYTGANLNQCNSLGAVMNSYQNICASSGQIPACYIPSQVNSNIINAC
jgi:hypothetical protein